MTSRAPAARLTEYLRTAGFIIILLLAFLVPLAFLPPAVARLNTIEAEIIFVKHILLRGLCTALVLVALPFLLRGDAVLAEIWRRARLFLILAGVNLLVLLASALLSAAPPFSLREIASPAALLTAVALAPLFIRTPRQVRAVLCAAVASGVGVALIGLVTRAGFGGFMRLIYGENPFDIDVMETGGFGAGPEGGSRRGPLMSTIGNVEYAGNFMAGAFLLAGCWLLDGWGDRRQRRLGWWIAGVAAAAILALAMVLTATRGVVIMTAAGLVARWLAGGQVRGLAVAAGLAVVVAVGLVGGLLPAVAAAGLLFAAAFVYDFRRGGLTVRWRSLTGRTRWLVVAGAGGALALTLAAAIPGPWQSRTFYLFERLFESTTTTDRSVRERLTFYMISAEMMRENPLLGVGPGLYGARFHEYGARLVENDPTGAMAFNQVLLQTWSAAEAHNDYFNVAAERGLLGLAALVGLFTVALGALARVARAGAEEWSPAALAVLTALAGYMGNMLTSFPLFEPARLTTIHVLVALTACIGAWAAKGVDAGAEAADSPGSAGK